MFKFFGYSLNRVQEKPRKRSGLFLVAIFCLCLSSCSSRNLLKRALSKEPELFTERITLASKIQAVEVPVPEINLSAVVPVIEGDTFVTVTNRGATITQTFTRDRSGKLVAETKVKIPEDTVQSNVEVPVMEIAPSDIVKATQKPRFKRLLLLMTTLAIVLAAWWLTVAWKRRADKRKAGN